MAAGTDRAAGAEPRLARRARAAVDEKALHTLEFGKIVARVAELCAFSVSRDLAAALTPSIIPAEVEARLALTTEAKVLLELEPSFSIGGARDVRQELREAG